MVLNGGWCTDRVAATGFSQQAIHIVWQDDLKTIMGILQVVCVFGLKNSTWSLIPRFAHKCMYWEFFPFFTAHNVDAVPKVLSFSGKNKKRKPATNRQSKRWTHLPGSLLWVSFHFNWPTGFGEEFFTLKKNWPIKLFCFAQATESPSSCPATATKANGTTLGLISGADVTKTLDNSDVM